MLGHYISTEYVDETLKDAALVFASARAVNGIISMLQSIELGVGVASVNPGEILDPLNDVVENFSNLMQLSVMSLILQKILLVIMSDSLFMWLITLSGAAAVAGVIWVSAFSGFALRVFLSVVFIRFSLAMVVIMAGAVDRAFLLEDTRQEMGNLDKLAAHEETIGFNVIEKAVEKEKQETVESLESKLDELRKQQEQLKEKRDSLLESLGVNPDKSLISSTLESIRDGIVGPEKRAPAVVENADQIRQEVSDVEKEIEKNGQAIEALEKEISEINPGLWGNIKKKASQVGSAISNMVDINTYAKLVDILQSGVDTMVNMMVLFFLKAMLLPLVFLFFFIRCFKLLWGVDMVVWFSKNDKPEHSKSSAVV